MLREEDKSMILLVAVFMFWLLVEALLTKIFNTPISETQWLVCGAISVAVLVISDIKRRVTISPINLFALVLGPVGLLTILTIHLITSIYIRRQQCLIQKNNQNT